MSYAGAEAENYKKAKYSWIGLWARTFNIRLKRKWRLTCSQFIALLLLKTNEIKLPKDPYLMLPTDFLEIEGVEVIFKGVLKDCVINDNSSVTV